MAHRISLGYTSVDEIYLRHLHDSISRLDGVEVYVAEWIPMAGVDLDEKVTKGLDMCQCHIALITLNSMKSPWVQQEIGYALAKGKRIIPVKEDGVSLGLLEGMEYIRFDPNNFRHTVYQIIATLRNMFPISTFHLDCPKCQAQFSTTIPLQEEMDAAIANNESFVYPCIECNEHILVNPTDLSIKARDYEMNFV